MSPRILAALGASLAIAVAIAIVVTRGHHRAAPPPPPPTTATTTAPPPTTTAPPPPPTTTTAPPPKPPPPSVAMSWDNAGAIVINVANVEPMWLGQTLRDAGFGWVAVFLGENGRLKAPDASWMYRFRLASGLPIGGWSSLGDDPSREAALAARIVEESGLSFYIADAENPYDGKSGRSQAFVSAFRAAEPNLPAGLSSFCNANGLDLGAWARGGFVFLPQAYVNDFGSAVAPTVCVATSEETFGRANVHPTVASYKGRLGTVSPARFAQLLAQAGTTGFSVFPAEVAMSSENWQAYGHAIASLHIATQVH
jgi:hypothetical protein